MLKAQHAAVERAHVRAELVRVAERERALVALHTHVALEQTDGGAQVGRGGALGVPVPDAEVLVAQGLVEHEREAAVLHARHAAQLLRMPTAGGRDDDARAHRPVDGLGE